MGHHDSATHSPETPVRHVDALLDCSWIVSGLRRRHHRRASFRVGRDFLPGNRIVAGSRCRVRKFFRPARNSRQEVAHRRGDTVSDPNSYCDQGGCRFRKGLQVGSGTSRLNDIMYIIGQLPILSRTGLRHLPVRHDAFRLPHPSAYRRSGARHAPVAQPPYIAARRWFSFPAPRLRRCRSTLCVGARPDGFRAVQVSSGRIVTQPGLSRPARHGRTLAVGPRASIGMKRPGGRLFPTTSGLP